MKSVLKLAVVVAATSILGVGIWMAIPVGGQSQATSTVATTGNAPKTAWGTPDLSGLWGGGGGALSLERDPKYGSRELLTEEERAAIVQAREKAAAAAAAAPPRPTLDDRPHARGTEQDVNGGY